MLLSIFEPLTFQLFSSNSDFIVSFHQKARFLSLICLFIIVSVITFITYLGTQTSNFLWGNLISNKLSVKHPLFNFLILFVTWCARNRPIFLALGENMAKFLSNRHFFSRKNWWRLFSTIFCHEKEELRWKKWHRKIWRFSRQRHQISSGSLTFCFVELGQKNY